MYTPKDEIRAGNLAVTVAATPGQIEEAQKLRFRIFYGEMGGTPSAEAKRLGRDSDEFDAYCDHLLVLDYDKPEGARVVGTYRLLRRSSREKLGRFYTESEFDISGIIAHPGEVMELGRSCVDEQYRNRAVMQLLWRGIANYVSYYDVTLMFGCASFGGVEPDAHALGLSYLYHNHLAPEPLRPRALPDLFVPLNMLAKDQINPKEGFNALPALLKGYLRLGGYIGDGAIIDRHCNTVDVCIIVKTDLVTDKYVQRYTPDKAE